MGIGLKRETFGVEDLSWLGKAHGHNEMDSITLDADKFLDAFPDGVVPSGVVLARLTATGLYAPYAGRTNEVQTLDLGAASAGTFTITFDDETTGAIAFNATAAAVQTALEALSNINPGDVIVTGGPLPGAITLTFGGQYAGADVETITVDDGNLTGATVTIATGTAGGAADTDGTQDPAGHLGTTKNLGGTTAATAQDCGAALFWHGEVIVSKLPNSHGLDSYARAILGNHIRYRDS